MKRAGFPRVLGLWGPVAAWAGLIFYFSSIPGLRITESGWDLLARKAAHLFVFGVLALLVRRALAGGTSWPPKTVLWRALLFTALYAVSDEVHQAFVPTRHGSPLDVLIDTVGAAAALRLFPRIRHLL